MGSTHLGTLGELDGWQAASTTTVRKETPRDYRAFDDLAFVTDLRPGDDLLILGDGAYLPGLKRVMRSVTYAGKTKEIKKLLSGTERFNRVFIFKDRELDQDVIITAAELSAGLICFLSEQDELRDAFGKIVSDRFPFADLWRFDSNVGPVMVTDARGKPMYL